jgi:hypothetical protein
LGLKRPVTIGLASQACVVGLQYAVTQSVLAPHGWPKAQLGLHIAPELLALLDAEEADEAEEDEDADDVVPVPPVPPSATASSTSGRPSTI